MSFRWTLQAVLLASCLVAQHAASQDTWQCTEPAVASWPVTGATTETFPRPFPDVIADRTRAEAAAALRAEEPVRALQLYRRGMVEDPFDRPMVCGAALAAVRASRPALALRFAQRAELQSWDGGGGPREAAACLYNAGLAYRAGGLLSRALRAYGRSLELRRSRVVRRALMRASPPLRPGRSRPDPRARAERRRLARWARVIERVVCHELEGRIPCDEEDTEVETRIVVPLRSASPLDARLLRIRVHNDDLMEFFERIVLVFQRGQTHVAAQLHELDDSAQGEYETFAVEYFAIVDTESGPRIWLETHLARASAHGDDRGRGVTRRLYLADLHGEDVRLRSAITEHATSSEVFGEAGDGSVITYRYDDQHVSRTCLRGDRVRVESQHIVGGVPFTSSDDIDEAPATSRRVAPDGPPTTREQSVDEALSAIRLFPLRARPATR